MQERIAELQSAYPTLNFALDKTQWDDDEEPEYYITVNGLKGNPDIQMVLEDEDDIALFESLPMNEIICFKDFFAINCEGKTHVLIKQVSRYRLTRNNPIKLQMNFSNNDVQIDIRPVEEDSILSKFVGLCTGMIRGSNSRELLIENYLTNDIEVLFENIRGLVNSTLFDVYYNFNIMFEPVSGGPSTGFRIRPKRWSEDRLSLIYKTYIPELVEYFKTAERVDYLPFKYLCYYNILEFFLDKSAYNVVAQKLKKIMMKPDFYLKTDFYVGQAVNIFKKENEKFLNDKTKVNRVLTQYVDMEEFRDFLKTSNLESYFKSDATLSCSKDLVLKGLNFESEGQFLSTLTSRIYTMRCSIVHSNPDFDESKAIPFISTRENLEKLRTELIMAHEIAKMVIIKTSYK